MYNFFSGLILRDGSVRTHAMIDSHSMLARYWGLSDSDHIERFAKVALVPGIGDWTDPESWTWTVDEPTRPGWLTDESEAAGRREMVRRAKAMIRTTGEIEVIADGCWILGGDVVVKEMIAGRVVRMWDSARVGVMRNSAHVGEMWHSAQVGEMRDSAHVGVMWDSAHVGVMWDSAHVGVMWDSAHVGEMWHSARVGEMQESARVGVMRHRTSAPRAPGKDCRTKEAVTP